MRVDRVTRQGTGLCNEDALMERPEDGLFAVLDGITPLIPWRSADGRTSGAVAAQTVRSYLEGCPATLPLPEMLLRANDCLRQSMEENGVNLADRGALWGCAGALVRIGPDAVEYGHAGDCLIHAVYEGGEVRELTRDSVATSDGQLLQTYLSNGRERNEHVQRALWEARSRANTPEGYTVINGDPALARFLEHGRISRQGLRALLLTSDGLTWPHPNPPIPAYAMMVAEILARGLCAYAEYVIALEDGDPDRVRFPRVKHKDDKTGLLLHL